MISQLVLLTFNVILTMLTINHSWLVVSNMFYFPFHIWEVIRNPLTTHIFQDG